MIVCFSGTGNSRYCAKFFAERLGDEITDSFGFIKAGKTAQLESQTPWIFICPTYGWRIPRIFRDFIKNSSFTGSKQAYFVMTCGSDIGGAATHLQELCQTKGFEFMGVLQVVMPENYIAMFGVPEKEEAGKIVRAALPSLEIAARRMEAGEALPQWKPDLLDRMKSGFVNSCFYTFIIKDRAFAAGDRCNGCGLCAKKCMVNNITIKDGKPVWGGNCIHCMACISYCPQMAIEYGRASQGKHRYQCEELEI